jgi:diacylglycerol kinase (ATP)
MNALLAATLNSLRGLRHAAASERAVRQELWTLALSLPAVLLVATDRWTGIAMVASLLLVLGVELLNTGLEKLCDLVHPGRHPMIGRIKDMGSAAVLCALLVAGLVWGAALLQRIGF